MAKEPECKLKFVSIGCNKVVGCADWGSRNGIYAFGGGSLVALWLPDSAPYQRIYTTLPGHAARVNAVRWCDPENTLLVSADASGRCIVWEFPGQSQRELLPVASSIFQAHSEPVDSVDIVQCPKTAKIFLATVASDGVKLWHRPEQEWLCLHTYQPHSLVNCVALTFLPSAYDSLAMALGAVDNNIHLYLYDGTLERLCSLRGHQDWVRALRFSRLPSGQAPPTVIAPPGALFLPPSTVLLASASQDGKVRLWRIEELSAEQLRAEYADATGKSCSPSCERGKLSKRRIAENTFLVQKHGSWRVSLESVLLAHEDWVCGLSWFPLALPAQSTSTQQPCILLSASMDRTMMIWSQGDTGRWSVTTAVGALGGLSGLFSQLGFFDGAWGPDGSQIVSHGYVSEFHRWARQEDGSWAGQEVPTGHMGPVQDLTMHDDGLICTVSLDQTTRMFVKPKTGESALFEIARSQIHGYDLNCCTFVPSKTGYVLASGADEKIVRIFDAPSTFFDSLCTLSAVNPSVAYPSAIQGAVVPALGLTNKPVFEGDDVAKCSQADERQDVGGGEFEPALPPPSLTALRRAPLEETLLQATLWPERVKLYGHPNELVCIAATHTPRYLASACRAQAAHTAGIIVWDAAIGESGTPSFKQLFTLPGHALTVTQLAYNPQDTRLVSVSRDRHCILWDAQSSPHVPLVVTAAHSRIIWTCAWNFDGSIFATGARDKLIKLWQESRGDAEKTTASCVGSYECADASTAIGFAPAAQPNLFVSGLENGALCIFRFDISATSIYPVMQISRQISHVAAVRRVLLVSDSQTGSLLLFTCSSDHSLRIMEVVF
eukprot:TRINITY_DN40652_c0_g1_i1.p1 TRINITY_DN40652_c0_g1~~TRINITY_DN40652_c0_g1_i1.p1  ORF type:complete len:839 (+),score=91.57 TRINITY_DN40652_c0_g1_i1:22-2517(+)